MHNLLSICFILISPKAQLEKRKWVEVNYPRGNFKQNFNSVYKVYKSVQKKKEGKRVNSMFSRSVATETK